MLDSIPPFNAAALLDSGDSSAGVSWSSFQARKDHNDDADADDDA